MEIKSYKELIVWQKSYQLVLLVYKVSKSFPKEELFGLVSQLRRAAVSIPSNIAEGNTRAGSKEYLQFLRIAFASGAELETQLLLCRDLDCQCKARNASCISLNLCCCIVSLAIFF